jgi:hypothetical protein
MRRKPPSSSSSSVAAVKFTRTHSRFSEAQTCSTIVVLPLPLRPVMNTGQNRFDLMIDLISLW